MNWLVGVDVDADSRGAVRLGRWLHDGVGDEVHAVHAVGRAAIGFHNRPGPGPDLSRDERKLDEFLAGLDADDALDTTATHVGAPQRVFARMLGERDFDALIVGRAAEVGEVAIARLGPVVRRVLRRATGPVLVAPPGLHAGDLGRGPIVVALRPGPQGEAAVRFGRRMSEHFGVGVRLVHVPDGTRRAPTMGAITVDSRDPSMARRDIVREPDVDRIRADLETWADAHGCGDLPLELRRGPRTQALLEAGRSHKATMLVCGRRHRTWLARWWHGSTSGELAAFTDRPLAVIPVRGDG